MPRPGPSRIHCSAARVMSAVLCWCVWKRKTPTTADLQDSRSRLPYAATFLSHQLRWKHHHDRLMTIWNWCLLLHREVEVQCQLRFTGDEDSGGSCWAPAAPTVHLQACKPLLTMPSLPSCYHSSLDCQQTLFQTKDSSY